MTDQLEQTGGNGSVEARARAQGWAPLEDWRGDPERWKTAEEFVETSERSAGVANETIRRMEKKLAAVEDDNQRLRDGLDELKSHHAQTAKREYDRAYAKIKGEMAQAVEEGDTDAFKKAEKKMDDLMEDQEKAVATVQPAPQGVDKERERVMNSWVEKHTWYETEPEMFDYAWKVDRMLSQKESCKKWTQQQFLDEILVRVQNKFSDYFEKTNPRRQEAGAVEGGSYGMAEGKSKSKGKGYSSLPPDAREACDRLTGPAGDGKTGAKIPGFTRAEYIRDYYGE